MPFLDDFMNQAQQAPQQTQPVEEPVREEEDDLESISSSFLRGFLQKASLRGEQPSQKIF
jgi:hypothetical protein